MDFCLPVGCIRVAKLFYGQTNTGKSMRAWSEAGSEAYPKDPRTKFWCGYQGQERVIIDEFRGDIAVSNILRWLDRYPVNVEIKGAAVALRAKEFWFTSNLPIDRWYPDIDDETLAALKRRFTTIIHFQDFFDMRNHQ